jgi:hypothetical protein
VRETFWQRLFRGVRRLHEQPHWKQFAGPAWADHIMHVPVTDRLHIKQGRSIARWTLESDGRRLVVYLKRHYRLPFWRGLLACLWPAAGWSPAVQEWRHLEWARDQGLPVPEAAAGGEYIGPWGRLQSFLAVEELTDMLPLHEAVPLASSLLPPVVFRRWKRGLAVEMARIARALHDRRHFHKDLYLCHFYVARADTACLPSWPGRVRLIDLHRLTHHPWTAAWWQTKDLGQLLYSSDVAGVTDRDRLWFWHVYRGRRRSSPLIRWLTRTIRLRAGRYTRHHYRRTKDAA